MLMGWEDQGRQYHMWFGHGTAGNIGTKAASGSSVVGQSTADRVLALAYGALASLPAAQRRQAEAQYQNGTLPRLKEAMTAWLRATALDQATFAARLFGRSADDPVVQSLHSAALRAATATSHDDFREAAGEVARAMEVVGIQQWPRFVADAQERARDPATQAAIEKSRQPPAPGRDAILPVYPLEMLLPGLGAKRAIDLARIFGGAMLRQAFPESRPSAGNAAANAVKPESAAGNIGKQAEPVPSGQPVRLHEGQQGKHIEGAKNYTQSRSTLTADPRALLQQFAGRGLQMGRVPVGQAGSKEVFDAGKIIGTYRTQAGLSAPTTRGMIHYSNKGAHIVPAAPRNWQP